MFNKRRLYAPNVGFIYRNHVDHSFCAVSVKAHEQVHCVYLLRF